MSEKTDENAANVFVLSSLKEQATAAIAGKEAGKHVVSGGPAVKRGLSD